MSKTKTLVIISSILVIIGIAIAGTGVALGGTTNLSSYFKDNTLFSAGSDNIVTGSVPIGSFTTLKVDTSVTDIRINRGDEYSLTYHVTEDYIPEVQESGDSLIVKSKKSGIFSFNFGLGSLDEQYIEITVPFGDDFYNLEIEGSTGDISVAGVNSKCNIDVSTGNISLSGCELASASRLEVSTGNITLTNCTAGTLHTNGSTGDHLYSNCEIEELDIKTSTGDVTFLGSTIKKVSVDGSTSDIKSTGTAFTNIDISVSSGDVNLSLPGAENEYDYDISLSSGDLEVDGGSYHKSYRRDKGNSKSVKISGSSSDVFISFED